MNDCFFSDVTGGCRVLTVKNVLKIADLGKLKRNIIGISNERNSYLCLKICVRLLRMKLSR